MHELSTKVDEHVDIVEEGKQKRLYSWLFLCDDCVYPPSPGHNYISDP
jgi:hypothetical protein